MSPYRPNPFFSTTNSFFLSSVGDKVDNAIAQGKALGQDAQAKVQEMSGKADLKYQDAKEAVKQTASSAPTGVDLYARLVNMITKTVCCLFKSLMRYVDSLLPVPLVVPSLTVLSLPLMSSRPESSSNPRFTTGLVVIDGYVRRDVNVKTIGYGCLFPTDHRQGGCRCSSHRFWPHRRRLRHPGCLQVWWVSNDVSSNNRLEPP